MADKKIDTDHSNCFSILSGSPDRFYIANNKVDEQYYYKEISKTKSLYTEKKFRGGVMNSE